MKKYQGVNPATLICYDENGDVCLETTAQYIQWLINKGVDGVYVCGSSGECVYQSVEERKKTLEAVVKVAKGKIKIIAHVACNNTKDSMELAEHAEKLGVDAIAAIPPIYFKLPAYAIEKYWNDISSAAPNTDFIIYNVPGLAGVELTTAMLENMLKNSRIVGVKNTTMSTFDIQRFKKIGLEHNKDFVVFNGPDQQYISGRIMGADAGIGTTYSVMPELFLKLEEYLKNSDFEKAQALQNDINEVITMLLSGEGHLIALTKEVFKKRTGIDMHGVRAPLFNITEADNELIEKAYEKIEKTISSYLYF